MTEVTPNLRLTRPREYKSSCFTGSKGSTRTWGQVRSAVRFGGLLREVVRLAVSPAGEHSFAQRLRAKAADRTGQSRRSVVHPKQMIHVVRLPERMGLFPRPGCSSRLQSRWETCFEIGARRCYWRGLAVGTTRGTIRWRFALTSALARWKRELLGTCRCPTEMTARAAPELSEQKMPEIPAVSGQLAPPRRQPCGISRVSAGNPAVHRSQSGRRSRRSAEVQLRVRRMLTGRSSRAE